MALKNHTLQQKVLPGGQAFKYSVCPTSFHFGDQMRMVFLMMPKLIVTYGLPFSISQHGNCCLPNCSVVAQMYSHFVFEDGTCMVLLFIPELIVTMVFFFSSRKMATVTFLTALSLLRWPSGSSVSLGPVSGLALTIAASSAMRVTSISSVSCCLAQLRKHAI